MVSQTCADVTHIFFRRARAMPSSFLPRAMAQQLKEFEIVTKAKMAVPRDIPWAKVNMPGTLIPVVPPPIAKSAEEEEQIRKKREELATHAQKRYAEWGMQQSQESLRSDVEVMKMAFLHPNDHCFRPGHTNNMKDPHAGEWATADKVLHERDRIQRAVDAAEASFLRHPPYPKSGGGVKNVDFSYMKSGYDYRLREPSKEISGTWPIMRVRPLTESARINESAAFSRPLDTLGGGRWVYDPKYGNYPACSPTTIGDSLRQSTSKKWLGRSTPKPPATAPPSLLHQPKWRGSFQTDFPPRSAVPADPLATNYGGYSGSSIGVQTWKHGAISMPWLHHTEEYVDHIHDTVAINAAHLPDTQRSNFRPVRQKAKELTGGDGRAQFWPQVPPGIVLPSPLSSCTWNRTRASPGSTRPLPRRHTLTHHSSHRSLVPQNVCSEITPPSPLPPRAYLKSGRGSPGLASGSNGAQIEQLESGVGLESSLSN